MYKLSQSTIEKLEHYVYLLSDPRTGKPFYVGKGCGNRINHHLLGALEKKTVETRKIKTIRAIQSAGKKVGLTILRHGLTGEEAFEVECAVIDLLGIDNLTNLVQGHYSAERGKMSLSDIEIEYEAKVAVFDEPIILININTRYHPGISSMELYDATKGTWVVGPRAKTIDMACAVYRGIIREVFKIQSWHKLSKKGRSYFKGEIAPRNVRNKYLHKSVKKYWKQGSQNPIKYVG